MIVAWLKKHGKKIVSRHSDSISREPHDASGDGLIYVTPKTLIKLRHAAENLPLKVAKVRALQSGEYYSPFKGRGMEFDEVRLYQAGDDIRTIDWRVTARSGKAHTKLFREERERAVLLWVDFRQSMYFGTQGAFKSVVAAKAAGLFAWSAERQGDRLGGLLFSENQHKELRPQRSSVSLMHMLQQLSHHSARDPGEVTTEERQIKEEQSLNDALSRLRRVSRPGSMLLLLSDFRGLNDMTESHLFQLARHNDVVLVYIYDPIEAQLPPAGYYRISDSQNARDIDTSDKQLRENYLHRHQAHMQRLNRICRRNHTYFLPLSTADDLLDSMRAGLGIHRHAS